MFRLFLFDVISVNILYQTIKKILSGTIDKEETILAKREHRISASLLEIDGFAVSIAVWINAHGCEDIKLNLLSKIAGEYKKWRY